MSIGASVGLFLSSLTVIMVSAAASAAETKNVRIMLDWIIQGTHAPFFIAQEKGYYKAEGVTVDTIDAGRGATNVAVSVAGRRLPLRLGRYALAGEVQRAKSRCAADRRLCQLR